MPCARNFGAPRPSSAIFFASASNTSMNNRPMVLRFDFRVVDAVERREEQLAAPRHGRAEYCSGRETARTTSSASPSRNMPWSTKTQVSASPIASWISTAATALNRRRRRGRRARAPWPDLLARIVWRSPRRRNGAASSKSPVCSPAILCTKLAMQPRAVRRVHDFEMELHGVEAARLVGDARRSAHWARCAIDRKAFGQIA